VDLESEYCWEEALMRQFGSSGSGALKHLEKKKKKSFFEWLEMVEGWKSGSGFTSIGVR